VTQPPISLMIFYTLKDFVGEQGAIHGRTRVWTLLSFSKNWFDFIEDEIYLMTLAHNGYKLLGQASLGEGEWFVYKKCWIFHRLCTCVKFTEPQKKDPWLMASFVQFYLHEHLGRSCRFLVKSWNSTRDLRFDTSGFSPTLPKWELLLLFYLIYF